MPWKPEKKAESRERILASAAHLFTQSGYDAISIDDVMAHAKLTRGAFYSHFKSKSELYSHAILEGAKIARGRINTEENFSVEDLASDYLQIGSAPSDDRYCPLAFLVTDICHRDIEIKQAYTQVLKGYQSILGGIGLQKPEAIQASVLMIGGLALSRAINDEDLKHKILESCLAGVKTLGEMNIEEIE